MRHAAKGDRDHAIEPLRMRTMFRSRLVKIAALMVACVLVAWQLWSAPLSEPGRTRGRTAIPVRATVETDPVQSSGDAADDPVIWRHPIDGAQSTIIGTDKKRGLMVYDVNGRVLQELPDGKLGNVDLRHDFPLGGSPTAIVTAGNRSDNSIAIYAIDLSTRRLRNVAARRLGVDLGVYGSCMYRSAVNGAYYVFITSKSGEVDQWRLLETRQGTVDAERVRGFDVGSQIEACVADDELGFLYIGEERVGIWKYAAEPTGGDGRIAVDSTGLTGFLTPDVEGLTIFFGVAGTGYLDCILPGPRRVQRVSPGGPERVRRDVRDRGGQRHRPSDALGRSRCPQRESRTEVPSWCLRHPGPAERRRQAELQARAVAGDRSGHPGGVRRATDLFVDGGVGACRCYSIRKGRVGGLRRRRPNAITAMARWFETFQRSRDGRRSGPNGVGPD